MISPEEQQFQQQSALQRQVTDAEQAQNAGLILQDRQMSQAALVEQINPNKIIKDIRLNLEGKEEAEDGTIKQSGEPIMNAKGISNVILIARSLVNQNTIMSSLDNREIGRLIIQVGDDLGDDLTLNWKEYGIKDKVKLDVIVDSILNPSFLALKRAKGGRERRFLSTVTTENISSSPQIPGRKKETLWSRFKL